MTKTSENGLTCMVVGLIFLPVIIMAIYNFFQKMPAIVGYSLSLVSFIYFYTKYFDLKYTFARFGYMLSYIGTISISALLTFVIVAQPNDDLLPIRLVYGFLPVLGGNLEFGSAHELGVVIFVVATLFHLYSYKLLFTYWEFIEKQIAKWGNSNVTS
jgi:hypothetical protein